MTEVEGQMNRVGTLALIVFVVLGSGQLNPDECHSHAPYPWHPYLCLYLRNHPDTDPGFPRNPRRVVVHAESGPTLRGEHRAGTILVLVILGGR